MGEDAPQRFSFAGRLSAGVVVVVALTAAVATWGTLLPVSRVVVFLGAVLLGVPLGVWTVGRLSRPLARVIGGLADGIRSFRDRDFSVRLASGRKDELGQLARLYNRAAELMLEERKGLRERELLLQTALDRSPAAILLVNQIERVIYANREARRLLTGGAKLEGRSFADIRRGCPPEMREILMSETDGLFTVRHAGEEERSESYHLSQRRFDLNRRRHTLILLRRMTGDLGRQEAEIWKKVIRVISHELNNSLAPVSSLVHSARVIAGDPEQSERSERAFQGIRQRLDHLKGFIDGYAQFARLPAPRKERVDWEELVSGLGEFPSLEVVGRLPRRSGFCDPAQMRQVLINLIKNAQEATEALEAPKNSTPVQLRIKATSDGAYVQVLDRGVGMDEETLKNSLLPFYSTKAAGTGLGLPLCREILEGHGGKLSIQARGDGGTLVTCWLPDS